MLVVPMYLTGTLNLQRQRLQNKRLAALFSRYKNGPCTLQQIHLFILRDICITKGSICIEYKCHGCYYHSHA